MKQVAAVCQSSLTAQHPTVLAVTVILCLACQGSMVLGVYTPDVSDRL